MIALRIVFAALALCGLSDAQTSSNQTASTRKPGLWELTTDMTWRQAPLPTGMANPTVGPRTTLVCLSQQQIDKYGTIIPTARGNCEVTDIVKNANTMTAVLVCTGSMSGKGSVRSSWVDGDHATGTVHFTGAMQIGQTVKPVEWTLTSTSVFKGPDCGGIKTTAIPEK